jgi:hypothetical protein
MDKQRDNAIRIRSRPVGWNRKLPGVSGIIHASGPRSDLPIPGTQVFRATDFVAFSDCIC